MPKQLTFTIDVKRDGFALFSFPVPVRDNMTSNELAWKLAEECYNRMEKFCTKAPAPVAIQDGPNALQMICEEHGFNQPCQKCFPRYAVTPKPRQGKRGAKKGKRK